MRYACKCLVLSPSQWSGESSHGTDPTRLRNDFTAVGKIRPGAVVLVSRSLFRPGSELVGPAELRKREHENKTGGSWGEKGRGSLSLSRPATFSRAFYFRVFFTFGEPGTGYVSTHLSRMLSSQFTKVCFQRESEITRGVSRYSPRFRQYGYTQEGLRSLFDSLPSRLSLLVFGVVVED